MKLIDALNKLNTYKFYLSFGADEEYWYLIIYDEKEEIKEEYCDWSLKKLLEEFLKEEVDFEYEKEFGDFESRISLEYTNVGNDKNYIGVSLINFETGEELDYYENKEIKNIEELTKNILNYKNLLEKIKFDFLDQEAEKFDPYGYYGVSRSDFF